MRISVVIPAYNAERFLAETLESVLKQTLQPEEIIVVDDGSTDRTREILQAFAPRVRALHTVNQRAAAARNYGVQHSVGDWIAFLDADDLWEPHKLQRQAEELTAHPDADLCFTSSIGLIQEGETARLGSIHPVPSASQVRSELLRRTTFVPSSVVVRRSTFLSVGGFDPRRRYAQDWDLWLRLLPTGARFIPCHEPLLRYRSHPGSMSSHTIDQLDSAKDVYRELVLPLLPPAVRAFHHHRFVAEHEAGAAYSLRAQNDPRDLPMLVSSIMQNPFYRPRRYKSLVLMLSTRLKRSWESMRASLLSV